MPKNKKITNINNVIFQLSYYTVEFKDFNFH